MCSHLGQGINSPVRPFLIIFIFLINKFEFSSDFPVAHQVVQPNCRPKCWFVTKTNLWSSQRTWFWRSDSRRLQGYMWKPCRSLPASALYNCLSSSRPCGDGILQESPMHKYTAHPMSICYFLLKKSRSRTMVLQAKLTSSITEFPFLWPVQTTASVARCCNVLCVIFFLPASRLSITAMA